jgi:hypothetical protein
MDNNFSDILETFKRLDEGVSDELNTQFDMIEEWVESIADGQEYQQYKVEMIDRDGKLQGIYHKDNTHYNLENMLSDIQGYQRNNPRHTFQLYINDNPVDWQELLAKQGEVDESLPGGSTMASAEYHSSGPKFTGYWKGTDPRTPGNKMVGASEGIELKLQNKYNQFLKEYGMTTGGTVNAPSNNPVDQAKASEELQKTQTNLNKFKSAGVNLPQGVGQASQAAVKTVNNPKADPTQTGLDQNAKKTIGSLGLEMEKLLATGNQSQVQQVANAIKQNKMGTK